MTLCDEELRVGVLDRPFGEFDRLSFSKSVFTSRKGTTTYAIEVAGDGTE